MLVRRLAQTLSDPGAKGWSEAAPHPVALSAAPLSSQGSRYIRTAWATRPYGLVRSVSVQAAHDGESLYIRLEWSSPGHEPDGQDRMPPGPLEGPDAFADAVAVTFPLDGDADPTDADLASMGSEAAPVGIWRWGAGVPGGVSETVEDLTARGVGTVRSAARASGAGLLSGRSARAGERRQVVLWRSLEPGHPEHRAFAPGESCLVGFSVWVGANQERAGIRSVSTRWSELRIED